MRARYSDFVCVVLHERARLGHDAFGRVHRPNPEMAFHATGHQVTSVRAERHASDVLAVAVEFAAGGKKQIKIQLLTYFEPTSSKETEKLRNKKKSYGKNRTK